LAQFDPGTHDELKARVDLPHSALRRNAEQLLAVLAGARELPESELPARLPGPLDAAQRKQLKQLKAATRAIAAELGSAPEALLQSKDYELLLREFHGETVTEPLHWQGWRRETVLAPLRASLAGANQ
jgi:ribonuclease D